MKLLAEIFGVIILIVVVSVVFLLFRINTIVEESVARFGPEVTGTPVVLNESDITPWTGKGALKGLSIGNPEPFGNENAFSLGEVAVDIDLASLKGDVIQINRIAIIDPEVLYLNNGSTDNLRALMDNITGRFAGGEEVEVVEEESGPAKKIIIDEFVFNGAKVSAGHSLFGDQRVDVNLPDLVLTGIGRESGGATLQEAGQQIFAYLNEAIQGEVLNSVDYTQALGQVQDRVEEEVRQLEQRAREEVDALESQVEEQVEEVEGQVRGLLDAFGR